MGEAKRREAEIQQLKMDSAERAVLAQQMREKLAAEKEALVQQVREKFAAFQEDLRVAINKHSMEQHFGNMPDFILAKTIMQYLAVQTQAIVRTEAWHMQQHLNRQTGMQGEVQVDLSAAPSMAAPGRELRAASNMAEALTPNDPKTDDVDHSAEFYRAMGPGDEQTPA